MSPPPSSPEHVCFYWHPGSDVSVFVWVMDVSTECRWHCQLLPTTHMPPTHHSSPQTACLTAQKKHKAHTCVYILLFIQRKQLGSRLSLRGQRSLIMYRLKSRIIIKTVSNSEKHSWGSPRKVPLSTSWRTPIDSKEISIPTFFVRQRRDLTRRNWFLQTIIVAEPRYNITGEKQDNKNRI